MRSAQITIKDIAKQLGISVSTVSRALKDHPDISTETKQKVQNLANELNYKPNAIALSLRKSKTNVIGIVIPQIVHHFFSSVISGIEEIAYEKGYNVIISQTNESYDREVSSVQTLISSRVDGIIISMTKETETYEHFRNIERSNIPMIFFDRTCPDIETDKVIVDDYKAALEATEYLIKTGCKKLLHLSGPENLIISKKRLLGFKDALKKHNLTFSDENIIKCDKFKKAKKVIRKLIQQNKLPEGIFAVNDMTALGALTELKRHAVKIPDEVSIMGFTNGLISKISDPSLSTVEQNGYEMGYKTAQILIERIEGTKKDETKTVFIPTKLIIRNTTK